MWHLIGIDKDGARHHWNECATKQEADILLQNAMPALDKMKSQYIDALMLAEQEREEIEKMSAERRPDYYDYLGWKMQGFYVDHFIIEERGE